MWKTWKRWAIDARGKRRRWIKQKQKTKTLQLKARWYSSRIKHIFGKKFYRFAFLCILNFFSIRCVFSLSSFSFSLSVVVYFRWFYSNLLVLEPQFVSFHFFFFLSLITYYVLIVFLYLDASSFHSFVCLFFYALLTFSLSLSLSLSLRLPHSHLLAL